MKKIAILLVIGFVLLSCGARKRNKTVIEEKTNTETVLIDSASIKDKVVFNEVKLKEGKDLSETVIEEVITEKEGVKETRRKTTIKNDKTTKDETTTNTSAEKEVEKKKTQYQHSEIKKTIEEVAVKRDAYSIWNLLWLLMPIGVAYLAYKYKDKIWWV